MGQQDLEKTAKEIPRIGESEATSSLPLDLTIEILLRLPAKSAVKFRCVSKLWSSITTLPSFISSFRARSSTTNPPRLLILSQKHPNLFVFSVPQNQNSDNKPVVVDRYVTPYPKNYSLLCTESVHGLICFSGLGTLMIWNPTMRRILTLPKPNRGSWRRHTIDFLGFDPIDDTYKVLSVSASLCPEGGNKPQVLTLNGAHESWRVIQDISQHCPLWRGQCINGVLYYGAYLKLDCADNFLVAFHVRSEKMSMIKVLWTHCGTFLVPYHGKLASVTSKADAITMWVLEDAEKHEWSCKHLHLPFPCSDPVSKNHLRLSGVNDAGEFVYVPFYLVNPFHILYFDPKRNSF